jgi:hypothetical protein
MFTDLTAILCLSPPSFFSIGAISISSDSLYLFPNR